MAISQDLAYQLFKVAQEKYDTTKEQLEEEKYQDAMRIARRALRIEEAVLSSDEAAKVTVPQEQVDDALEEIRQRYQEHDDFVDELNRSGFNEDFLYQALARELHVNAVLDYVSFDCPEVSDTDIDIYYYLNIAKFFHPEIRTARHILVTVNDDNSENLRETSFRKISQIAARIQKKPERFEEQALKHSECPTSLQGGLLGKIKRDVLYPEIEKVLFDLKVGELSPVVESPLGFHLVRCDEIQEEGTLPLSEVMPGLRAFLENRNRKQKQRQWLENLLQKSAGQKTYMSGEIING